MKKVLIVGGGVAGLSCGKRLVDSGKFDVILLEADTRVGGRVETKKFGEHYIENGAQWVHGEDGNKIFQIANSMKLLDVEENNDLKFTADTVFVTDAGRKIEKQTHDKISLLLAKILDGPEDNEVDGSVGDWAIKKFEREVEKCSLDPKDDGFNASLLDWIHRFQDNIDGADNWFQSSLRGQHEYWECEGNPTVAWKSPACYSSLLGIILNNTPILAPTFQPELPSWIETEKNVIKIEMLNPEKEPIRVTCSDKSQYACDHLISTVSLGVLKHFHKDLFHPPLPERKVLAIEGLGIGCVNKLHFDFKKQWWPDDILGFNFLWKKLNHEEKYWNSSIQDDTLAKEVDGFPLWCRNILGFYRVSSHPTALNSWITGPAAKYIEKLPDVEVKRIFIEVCRKFLKDYDVPDPEEFCRSSWFSNRYTKGSYSFREMKSEKCSVWASDLAKPILNESGVPAVCFAGEATHDHFYSTVHGAYESGLREADRLINSSLTGK